MTSPHHHKWISWRSPQVRRASIELAVVGGGCLVALFWIIPEQTSTGRNLALSASFLPIICASFIGLLALANFVTTIMRHSTSTGETPIGFRDALMVIGASVIGILAIRYAGWIIGSATMALLVSLCLGERRPLNLVLLTGGVALLLFVIGQLGI